MDAQTRVALEGAIQKWEKIVSGEDVDMCGDNCPLCILENRLREDDDDNSCGSCPVAQRTGQPQCDGSPWDRWATHQQRAHKDDTWPYRVREGCDECKKLAEAELEFLKSLRE